ncbi:helix-turn-helix transcriptional regulator [Streptomyces sp. NPDC005865]|uniref:helix-turn-helix transcriptional regulator n=1 Tax=Streptomyces sp. NPDC005865 TaxID=3155453 RepID=UPI0033DCF8FB
MLEQPVFGAELRRSRMAAGLTLTEFASSVHYSKGQISKVETGNKKPTPEFARLCDAALDADGALAALVPPADLPPAALTPGNEAGEAMRGRTVPSGAPTDDHHLPSRRRVMAVGAASVLGVAVSARPVPAAAGASAEDSGSGLLAASRGLFDQYRGLGQLTPPTTLLPALIEQSRATRELAARCAPAARTALLTLASRYAEFAGWMAQETGDDAAALRWTEHAVDLAESAGDHDLASYALVRRALISYYQGDAADTIALAEGGRSRRLPPRIRGLATQQLAQGHALAGDHDACLRRLDQARALLDDAERPDPSAPVLGATHLADPITMITGWCLVDLGRPQQAAAFLDRACAGLPPTALRTQARYGVRRALAHARAGEIEHSCAVVRSLLPAVRSTESATVRLDLRRLTRTLARFRSVPAVAELSPELTAALHGPVR